MDEKELTIEKFENDDFYKFYLKNEAKAVLDHSLTISEQVKKLGVGIEIINKELQTQVLQNHNDLLSQAHHATKLENVLNRMSLHIQNLLANAERLKAQINIPYSALETHTKVLRRLHMASHILRQVNRVQQLSKRLTSTNDPVQKATVIQELEQLALDPELKDVDAVTSELRNIREQQQKVDKLATSSLNQGVLNENTIQTVTALQIFVNLGKIEKTTESFIEQSLNECQQVLKTAFEIHLMSHSKKVGAGRVALTSSQGFRNKVWSELEKVFTEDFYQICKQVKFFQTTINSLQFGTESKIAQEFWLKLGQIIKDEVKQSSPAVQQMLEEDYPKLLKNYYELCEKLKYDQFVFDRQVLKQYENSYLSTSLTKILDPTQSMFNMENNVPTHDQIDALIRVITSEVSVSLVEEHLSEQICKNVAKSIKMFAVKTEQQLETGPEAAQVIGGAPNSGQQKNVQYANALYYLQTQIHRMVSNMKENLSNTGVKIILESVQSIDSLVSAIMQPLITSINSVIETIIVTLHLETDWMKLSAPHAKSVSCSPYMRELTQFIQRVYNTYLSSFENKDILWLKCKEIAVRCIELFVRHSSILRPVSQGGRMRLQSDYQHLENALKVICPNLSDLGRPYRLLKSMALLIALSPEEIIASQVSGSSVRHSTILFMLFAFAESELASPHQNTGWSLPKISAWLDEHPSEEERLDLIAGALQKYETIIRQTNSANYDPVYPLMSSFLEKSIKQLSTV